MLVELLKNGIEWENFLQVMPESTFYHSLKWKEVIERSFPVQTFYSAVRSEDGKLVGVCPACVLTEGSTRILDSMPFSDFGGPLVEKRGKERICALLYRTIGEFCRENGISFAKICFSRDGCEKLFVSPRCFVWDGKGVVRLELTSTPSDMAWKNLKSKQRQQIRKLEKNGFEVREAASKSDLRTFLSLYNQNMQYLRAPSYNARFFENVWDLLYPQNFEILFAEMKASLAGVAFFKYRKAVYLTYFGMDRPSLQHTPPIAPFLYWKAINWAEENGFTTVYFGSTPAHPKGEQAEANYSQKMAFGSSFQPQDSVYIPFDFRSSITFLVRQKAVKTWRSMKNATPQRLQKIIEHQTERTFE